MMILVFCPSLTGISFLSPKGFSVVAGPEFHLPRTTPFLPLETV